MPSPTPNMAPPTPSNDSANSTPTSCRFSPSCPNRQDLASTVRLAADKIQKPRRNAEPVTTVRRRSRRLAAPSAGQSEQRPLAAPSEYPTGQIHNQQGQQLLPEITTQNKTWNNPPSYTDFELAQFLSPTPVDQSNSTDVHDLLPALFSERTQSKSLQMSSLPRTPDNNAMVGGMAALKEEHDISQYLTDFFSTLPAPTVTAVPQYAPNPSSIAMSNAFKSLSPVETSPFFFDQDIPPMDTPALEPDDGDLSSRTSPMWQSLSLFPEQEATVAAPKFPAFYSFGDEMMMPQTISPVELSLPLPSFDKVVPEPVLLPSLVGSSRNKRPTASSPAFDIPTTSSTSDAVYDTLPSSSSAPKRRRVSHNNTSSSFNGTRNTSIPLLDETAPTQSRKYVGPPSKTSKRDIPAAAARKVAALLAHADEFAVPVEEEISKSIEDKRRQNTVAARRSRQRKAEHLQELEEGNRELRERIRELEMEKQVWEGRARAAGWTEEMRGD